MRHGLNQGAQEIDYVAAKPILVMDEQHFCTMMVEMLTGARYRVESTAHPILAAERALSGDFDLITQDLNLEEFNGKDV